MVRSNLLQSLFLGTDQAYAPTLRMMHATHAEVCAKAIDHQLLFVEHSPVITITRQHMHRSIKTSDEAIMQAGIELAIADRGGDATFHGPGQLVGYPIIDLGPGHEWHVEYYLRGLEHSLLVSLQTLGINNIMTLPKLTGIWYRSPQEHLQKLVAIGVGIKDGVTKHGFALNVDIDYQRYTEHIIPCGLKDHGITTLKAICEHEAISLPTRVQLIATITKNFASMFSLKMKSGDFSYDNLSL